MGVQLRPDTTKQSIVKSLPTLMDKSTESGTEIMKPLSISAQDQERGLSSHITMLHIHFRRFTL